MPPTASLSKLYVNEAPVGCGGAGVSGCDAWEEYPPSLDSRIIQITTESAATAARIPNVFFIATLLLTDLQKNLSRVAEKLEMCCRVLLRFQERCRRRELRRPSE